LLPTREEGWLQVAKHFNSKWNFPHCLGAINGKHVVLQCPANGGNYFFNYKGTFSIILRAAVDANYLSMHTPACKGKHVMVVYFYIAHFIMHT